MLKIQEVAAQTGVPAATLRAWEERYGFPKPERLPSGHRRYRPGDVRAVAEVLRLREGGMALPAAIERARSSPTGAPAASIFAALRRRRPDMATNVLNKRAMLALSQALEDECIARGERAVLIGAFQRERFYRHSELRWTAMARTAEMAVVIADFAETRLGEEGPAEIRLDRGHPVNREWCIVSWAPGMTAALAGWEVPSAKPVADWGRRFEAMWTLEPDLVHAAAMAAADVVAPAAPRVAERLRLVLGDPPPPSGEQVRLLSALARRMVAYASRITA